MLCEWTNTLLATALLVAVTVKSQEALVQLDF